jgi:hypothetical protein
MPQRHLILLTALHRRFFFVADITAKGRFEKSLFFADVEQGLRWIHAVTFGVAMLSQLKLIGKDTACGHIIYLNSELTIWATFPGPQATSKIFASLSTSSLRNASQRTSGYRKPKISLAAFKSSAYRNQTKNNSTPLLFSRILPLATDQTVSACTLRLTCC